MKDKKAPNNTRLGKTDYEMLAAFRYALRRFLSFSEAAAREIGLASQQYQALLAVKGYPGRDDITINELAQQLLIKHNSAVGLVDRLESEGLVQRRAAAVDRRKINIRLTPKGTRVFERLVAAHHAELTRMGPQLKGFFDYLSRPPEVEHTAAARRLDGARSRMPTADKLSKLPKPAAH